MKVAVLLFALGMLQRLTGCQEERTYEYISTKDPNYIEILRSILHTPEWYLVQVVFGRGFDLSAGQMESDLPNIRNDTLTPHAMLADIKMHLFQFQMAILAGRAHERLLWEVAEEWSLEHLHAE
jgi:hypothetical protein